MTLDFSDVSTYLIDIGFALLVTVLLYLAVPIFLVFIRKKSFTRKRARMIAIINTVVVYIIFMVIVIVNDGGFTGNITPAIVWGIVGYRILLKNEISSDETGHNRNDYDYMPQPQFIQTPQNSQPTKKKNTPVIVLSLLLIVVVAVSTTMIVINYGKYDKLLRANEALVEESQDWQAKIAEERLESYNTIKKYQDKVWFLDKNIVFVLDYDDVHYYTYDQMMEETKDIDDYSYRAFNVNAAKSRGYVSR